jgi:hypothetical protein
VIKVEDSPLPGLDVFLNLTLIIDEVLKVVYRKNNNGNLRNNKHAISDSILWLCDRHGWMNSVDLSTYWGSQYLNLNDSDPDIVVPKLLTKLDTYKGNSIPREVLTLLIAYKFRNYGAHNLRQQNTVVTRYEEIIRNLLFSLFISIENL